MNILTSQPAVNSPTLPAAVRNKKIPAGATVSHDPEKDCFSYSAPGHHYSVCRENPLAAAAKVGAFVAVPAFVGAFENEIFGTLTAGIGGTWTGIIGGLALGAAIGGYKSYKGSNNNPMYGVLGGVGGAAAGALMFPLLKQPGLWGGITGAAVATGVAALGVGIFSAVQNHRNTQDAIAMGWNPKG